MTSIHDHTPFDAVDALFELRAQMARLRDLEAELCDEIRSFATENGGQKVFGAARVAVIETRMPSRINPSKLPPAILKDPHFFAAEEETVVLLWPRPAAAQPSLSTPVSIHVTPDVTGDDCGASALEAPDENTSVDTLTPAAKTESDAFVSADDPFGLKSSASQSDTPTPEMPMIDARGAKEGKTPKDLRPKEHAHLQPLAGLPDEDVAQMIIESEATLAPASLPDALEKARALEAEADQLADLSADMATAPLAASAPDFKASDFDDSNFMPSTAFSSRRISVGGGES
ncbi:hypothetical protein [Celeribacter sp. PS-C1]|uniref:hypothetical protein n=1 Tax=Celeribacter sp. PS-C1 TaxID=2820813 RepID=UPI001CA5B917|nr:hypothetical protein [Celeribacter sp. PS-C1]MBW6418074.1 hypothetical protein [Celeribacter sp. PS-C1]